MAKVKFNLKTKQKTFIREWRNSIEGLTQARLSERIGVSEGAISQLENGTVAYTQPMLEALADALNCSPADLIMRPPTSPERLELVWNQIPSEMQEIAINALKAFIPKRTGTR